MSAPTAAVPVTCTKPSDTKTKRPLAATAQTYYPGEMIALDSSGNATKCSDTAALKFDGIMADSYRITVDSGDAAGDKIVTVEQPRLFIMKIAAAVAGDEGKKVYAVFSNEVGYTSSNSIQVGYVHRVVSATEVEVRPLWSSVNGTSNFDNTTLSFTGANALNNVAIPDNLAQALVVQQGTNVYAKFVTTDGSETAQIRGPDATGATNAGGGALVTGGIGGATSGAGGTVTIAGGAGTAGNAAGGAVSSTGGAGQGSAAGGASSVVGGAGGATGVGGACLITGGAGGATSGTGGAVTLTGGAGTTGNSAGGAASLIGGAGQGSAAGGAVTITSGAAGATGVAGAVNISVGGATSGNGSSVTITGGAGAGGTNAGGNVNLVGGAAVSTGTPGEVQVNGNSGLIPVQVALTATDASRAVFIATRACRLKAVSYMHTTGSTSGTLQVEKLTGTTAAGSGTVLLTGTIDLSATTVANTTTNGTLIATVASLTLAAGDRLGVKIAGTMTNLVGAIVTMMVAPA